MDINKILRKLTLEEKASLCSGSGYWTTEAIERLGIPSVMMTDGPHGLRKQTGGYDHLGINDANPATCFPTAATTACSWDEELLYRMGEAIAEECLQEGVSVILGPGANIKRSPLCGRNFEYFSEDPYLTGVMATAMIKGVQSKGVGTSLKHFAINNQECRRMTIDAVVDERAKREIYLAGFEKAVKEAQPWTVMCSYNRENGTYLSENERLLTGILRDEWGFEGMTVTDWGACNDRVAGVKAGMDLEMPTCHGRNTRRIIAAVKRGDLSMEALDKVVMRVIKLVQKCAFPSEKEHSYCQDTHHSLAREIALNSMVLLKNDGLLPLSKNERVGVIGEFAVNPRYQGAGSSMINPCIKESFCEVLDKINIKYQYTPGYRCGEGSPNTELISEAVEVAKNADTVLLFVGLTEDFESEGFDRKDMKLPESHTALVNSVVKVNPNVVVVLQNGAPIEMPWGQDVKAIFECYLSGQAGASATADILYGDVNPSGKLAETFPHKLEDNPSYRYFPGCATTVEYRESIYVGYRYYDKAKKDVRFPFGHGLSYTTFAYSDLVVEKEEEFEYYVSITVTNTGDRAGAEVVQLYVINNDSPIFKAEKELRAFKKVYLEAGESKSVAFKLRKRDFAYYNVQMNDWHVDSGEYGIMIGASSRDIRLTHTINLEVADGVDVPDTRKDLPGLFSLESGRFSLSDSEFACLIGKQISTTDRRPFDRSVAICDIQHKIIGRYLYNRIMRGYVERQSEKSDERTLRMFEYAIKEMPLRALEMFAGDTLPEYFVDGVVEMLNGRYLKGLRLVTQKVNKIAPKEFSL